MGLTSDENNDSQTTCMDEYELVDGEKVPGGLTQYLTKKEARFRQLVNHQPMSIWSKCWEEGITPWDAGDVLPIVEYLVKEGQLPNGTALVPGCGSGYDAIALASPSRHVIGLDISEQALNRAKQLAASSPNGEWVEFLNAYFYTFQPPKLFDLIFDYTFFCAMEPFMRSEWGKRMAEFLDPDGELITLMFPLDNHAGGPPYAVSVEAYEEVLHPLGLKAYYMQENELSIETRKGR